MQSALLRNGRLRFEVAESQSAAGMSHRYFWKFALCAAGLA
jgi:hypothetical protein